jgi:rhodanese-related sulfurtransferase
MGGKNMNPNFRMVSLVAVSALALALAGSDVLACATCGCSGPKAKEAKLTEGECEPCKAGPKAAGEAVKEAASHSHEAKDITTPVLKSLLESGAPVVVLDARTGQYDDGRRIPGAKALSPEATAEQAAKLIPEKSSLVVVYCSNLQCPASRMLGKRLHDLGYENVLEYAFGIQGWADAGNEVEKAN